MKTTAFILLFLVIGIGSTSAAAAPTQKSSQKTTAATQPNADSKLYHELLAKAESCLNQNRAKMAIQLASEAIEVNPTLAEAYYVRGGAFRRNRQLKSAMADLDRSLSIKETGMAYLERGTTLASMGYVKPAIEAYSKCIRLMPKDDRAYYRRGFAYQEVGDYKSALKDFNKIVELLPDRTDGFFGRGSCYMGLCEPLNAIRDFDKVIARDGSTAARFNKASCLVQADRPAEAIGEYTFVLKHEPQNQAARMNRGRTYLLMNKPDEAIQDFTRVLAHSPNAELLYLFRGRAYQLKGDMKHADADLRLATLKENDFAVSHFESGVNNLIAESPSGSRVPMKANSEMDSQIERALALQKKKKYKEALEALNNCIAAYPKSLTPQIAKAKLLNEMKKPDEALISFTVAWRRDNLNVEAIHGKVMTYMAMGEPEHALPDLNKLIWFDPFCPNYYFEKGEALRAMKKRDAASNCYKKFLSMVDERKSVSSGPITKYGINPGDIKVAKEQLANRLR
jgi:tetratricopeptide (TPR) repeat protein